MDREALKNYISEIYNADAEHPWDAHPSYMVFRHGSNRKWFAVIMTVPREKLALPDGGEIDILNVKCDARMIGSFRAESGIFPAYHMSKATWLSVALDGTATEERIKLLLEMSYDLTAPKRKKDCC